MSSYRVETGDTFASVARKRYGDESEAGRIARANPGATEPLAPGMVLAVPAIPCAPVNMRGGAPAADPDEVALSIEGQRFRYWESVRITHALDSLHTVEFGAPFDHAAAGFRDTFRPFSFRDMAVTVGGAPLFTGTMVGINPDVGERKTIQVNGYATPGALADCTAPASAYPLEFNDQNLKQIAEAMAAPFGVTVDFGTDPGAPFERVACAPTEKVLSFLTELAKQRGILIASSAQGALVFLRPIVDGSPVARLTQGVAPLLTVSPAFSPQEYYSHITGVGPAQAGLPGEQYTARNDRLAGVTRPLAFNVDDGDVRQAAEAKAGRMFAAAAPYAISVPTWRDPAGQLWRPNTIIELEAPDAMVYAPYRFLVRRVSFEASGDSRTAALELVIPAAFSGRVPEGLPWDG